MKPIILSLLILLSFSANAQVFKSAADADVKAANNDSMFFISANVPLLDTIPISDTIPKLQISNRMMRTTTLEMLPVGTALFDIPDTIPITKPIWKTTVAKDKIVSVSLLLTKADGSIIIIDSAWKMNVRNDVDKIMVIYPDSSRTIYRISTQTQSAENITIPFKISKKRFDEMSSIKLEIIR